MNKWLNRLLEKEARKPRIDNEVSVVSAVPSLSTHEKCEIDKKSLKASTTAPNESSNKEIHYLNNIETPYHQNHRNLLSEKSKVSLEMQCDDDAIVSNPKLAPCLTAAKNASTLAELETILKDFSNGTWALVDKAALSDAYTPIAKKLIEIEQANKWQWLENLACLCFKPS